ncbi:MAG: ATP-binding protein [Methylomonas sp.]|nr:MAG: ATP-binding protein [Methylomonas sp.]
MSLRRRLNRGLIIILTVVFTANWLAADWVIRGVAEREMLTRLVHDGDSLLDSLQLAEDGQLKFDISHAGSVYGQAFSGHYFLIHLDGRVLYSPSLQETTLPFQAVDGLTSYHFHFQEGPKQQPLLILSRGVERLGHHISISVAEELTAIDHDISGVRLAYSIFCLLVLMIAIVLQTVDVKRSLSGFKVLREELTAIASGQQQQVGSTATVPAEVRPLVKELNRLLLLVDRRMHQSRTALGNVAHALKTPLAMLYRLAESPALTANPELTVQIQQQNQIIHQRIERELKRARISGTFQAGANFNPQQELTALVQLLRNIYSEKTLNFQIQAPDQLLSCDREDMLELMGNLLDNACKWAEQCIEINVNCDNGIMLSVADDGPGCALADMQQLLKRGVRLDENIQGHGLGLAIVQDIAEFYGGVVSVQQSESLGGLQVKVYLPKV